MKLKKIKIKNIPYRRYYDLELTEDGMKFRNFIIGYLNSFDAIKLCIMATIEKDKLEFLETIFKLGGSWETGSRDLTMSNYYYLNKNLKITKSSLSPTPPTLYKVITYQHFNDLLYKALQ